MCFLGFHFVFVQGETKGFSMYPTFQDGDVLLILPQPNLYSNLTGQIIGYKLEGFDEGYIAHRVVLDNGDYVLTKGDHNNYVDEWKINKSQIFGVVITVLPSWATLIDLPMYVVVGVLCIGVVLVKEKHAKKK